MMADQTIVNYELLEKVSKFFDTQQEETARAISELRQKAQALETEWIGEGADQFFDEFFEVLMPGMDRLRQAHQISAETLVKIIRVFDEAENETQQYFGEDKLESGGTGGIDVTGLEFNVFKDMDGTSPGGSGIDVTGLDFDVFGDMDTGGTGGDGQIHGDDTGDQTDLNDQPDQTDPGSDQNGQAGSGGQVGGGGGGGSQSGENNLRMGVGTGNNVEAGTAGMQGSADGSMQDHIYESSGGGGGGQQVENPSASEGGSDQEQSGGNVLGAAGAVGGMAAAAGAVRKATKGKKEEE